MAEFDDSAALSAYKDWNSAVGTLWTLFSGAALGIGAIAAKSGTAPGSMARWGLMLAFSIFAVGNHIALARAQRLSCVLVDSLKRRGQSKDSSIPSDYRQVFEAADASSVRMVRIFHVILSLATCAAILCLTASPG